jgi:RNA polymerase sigma-70 factor (ECF subfamily)
MVDATPGNPSASQAANADVGDDETAWVLQARAGDAAAFGHLVDRYDRRLLYYLQRFLPRIEQALDVLQDVWLTLFRRLPDLRHPQAFRAWLYQVAHDQVVAAIRKDRREREAVAEIAPWRERTEELDLSVEQAEFVHQALAALSNDHRSVLTLFFLNDLTLEEIGTALRLPLGTVKSRLHYARRALRRALERLHHA